jgi:UDP-glucose 4-epimerase
MKILVVGGGGEVGRYLMNDFARKGHDVTGCDRVPKPQEMQEGVPLAYLQGDIADVAVTQEAVQGKDIIIHLAWSFADDAKTVFDKDIKGHLNLLEAASSFGIRSFIYTSTATVYGRACSHPVTEDHPCLIDEARKPLYALGKYTAEELCKVYNKERGLPVTIFRFWWAFGESIGGRHLRDLIRKAMKDGPLEMVGDAGGAFVTMGDLGRAILAAITKPAPPGQIYNVGSLFLAWEEIGEMIIGLMQSKSAIQRIPSAEWKGPAFLNEVWDLSWDKARRELDYEPRDPPELTRSLFSAALKRCIAEVEKDEK